MSVQTKALQIRSKIPSDLVMPLRSLSQLFVSQLQTSCLIFIPILCKKNYKLTQSTSCDCICYLIGSLTLNKYWDFIGMQVGSQKWHFIVEPTEMLKAKCLQNFVSGQSIPTVMCTVLSFYLFCVIHSFISVHYFCYWISGLFNFPSEYHSEYRTGVSYFTALIP